MHHDKTHASTNPSTNPFGGRIRTSIHRQAEATAENFCGLLPQTNRFTVVRLLRQIGRDFGWTGRLIDHLELLISHSQEDDWRGGNRPLVWLSLQETAFRLNISKRQARRNENALLSLGAIAFQDSANCRRFGYRDEEGRIVEAYGLDLSPCAELIPRLTLALEQAVANREKYLILRRRISATRRRIRSALVASLGRKEVKEAAAIIEQEITQMGPVHDGRDPESLEQEARRLDRIDHQLRALLDGELGEASDKNVCQARPQRPPGRTPESAPEYKNLESEKINPDKPQHGHPPKIAEVNPKDLLAFMPEPVLLALPPQQAIIGWTEIVEAAQAACHYLGISRDAWVQACHILGRRGGGSGRHYHRRQAILHYLTWGLSAGDDRAGQKWSPQSEV